DRADVVDRDRHVARDAAEARLELEQLVADVQPVGGLGGDVQHDLAVAHELAWDERALVDRHRDERPVAVVRAPLVDGADEIRLRRYFGHQRRITFSEGVSASMYA